MNILSKKIIHKLKAALALILTANLFACSFAKDSSQVSGQKEDAGVITAASNIQRPPIVPEPQAVPEPPNVPEPQAETPKLSEKDEFINRIISEMTIDEKIGQLFMLSFETKEDGGKLTELDESAKASLEKYKPCGVIYFAANIDSPEQVINLSRHFQESSKIPMLIGIDEEGGRVTRITKSDKMGLINTPTAKTLGNTKNSDNAYFIYDIIAKELGALGINVGFAPVADLNVNNQGVIGDRAFGADCHIVSDFVIKSVSAFKDNGIISAIKHFPGHGIAPGDTHDEKIVSEKSLDEILSSDIIPFTVGANSGVPMIMLSHITLPEWDMPASMSKEATSYIREQMGYDGIIITDSFRMGAITSSYPADIAAANAIISGVDIVLMPEDTERAINGVKAALNTGEISESRIEESLRRVLSLKYDYGLFNKKWPSIDEAKKILDNCVNKLKNNKTLTDK